MILRWSMIKAAILTVSDTCAQGSREDISGQTIADMLAPDKFKIGDKKIVPDDFRAITGALKGFCDNSDIDVVLTTGGTGLGGRA